MGPRFYDALFFADKFVYENESRKIRINSMLEFCRKYLWKSLFGKEANSIEHFVGYRKHS